MKVGVSLRKEVKMNIKHILKRCIDALYSKRSQLMWAALDDDHTLVCPDGRVVYKFSNEDLKLRFTQPDTLQMLQVWKQLEKKTAAGDYRTALLRYDVDAPEGAKPIRRLAVFNEKVYINADLLNSFDKDAEIRIADPLKQVLVFEAGEMVGVIYPVNMRKYGGVSND